MSAQYANVFPMSQQEFYYAQSNVDFILQLDNAKLLPGSLCIEGEVAVFPDKSVPATQYDGQDLMYDARAGYHALFRDLTTELQTSGVLENLLNYPRLVKMATVALTLDESLGSESVNAVEGKLMNNAQTRGNLYGRSTTDPYIPFSVKPMFCLNKASAAMAGSATGQVRVRVRLAPDEEFLFGSAFVLGTTGYIIKNLRLRYMTIPDDGKKQTIQVETYQTFRSAVDSNNQNISTYIPGNVDSVHMSFIPQINEGTPTKNYLQLAVPPGVPPLGASSSTYTGGHYGIERLYYAISDVDSALVGFTMESREEIVHNGLRSFKASADKYGALIRHFNDEDASDCYIAGIPMGGLIDFSRNKFAVEIQSKCSNENSATGVHVCYIYARCLSAIEA
jgi:hypothetical protein